MTKKPENAEAHVNRGLALESKGDLKGAEAEYREAIRLDPKYADAHHYLGFVLAAEGDQRDAETEFREALRLRPDYAGAHNDLGYLLGMKGDRKGAEEQYREAIRLEPDFAGAHLNLGRLFLQKGDLKGAEAETREALRLRPDYPEAHCALGETLVLKDDMKDAYVEFQEAIQLKPDYAEAHLGLGAVLEGLDFGAGALAEYKKALEFEPSYSPAREAVERLAKEGWETRVQMMAPGYMGVLEFDSGTKDFETRVSDDGLEVQMRAMHRPDGLLISAFLRKVGFPASAEKCRDSWWPQTEQSMKSRKVEMKNLKMGSEGAIARVEYLVPFWQGAPINQMNVHAYLGSRDLCAEIHLSKVSYSPGDQKLFDDPLKTVRLFAVGHAAEAPPPTP